MTKANHPDRVYFPCGHIFLYPRGYFFTHIKKRRVYMRLKNMLIIEALRASKNRLIIETFKKRIKNKRGRQEDNYQKKQLYI